MPRHTVRRMLIQSRHPDKTACSHRLTSSGKPRDPESGCAGRGDYLARCTTCTWSSTGSPRTSLEYAWSTHACADHQETLS